MKGLHTLFLLTLLFGCSKENLPNSESFQPPQISYEGRAPVGEKVDPALISPENNGYNLDMDGDKVQDFVIFRSQTLFYAKGKSDGSKYAELPILNVKGNLMAYMVQEEAQPNGKTIPVFHFWNDQKDGFLQKCLGVNGAGIPFFGDIESD